MIVFMIFNMIISSLSLARYSERQTSVPSVVSNAGTSDAGSNPDSTDTAIPAATEAESPLNAFLDSHFPDERMERIYPNAKLTE